MNGIEFLTRLMRLRPMPVVMISTLTVEGADVTLQALELGAVDYVSKPTRNLTESMDGLREEILSKVRAAAGARLRGATRPTKAIGVGDIQAVADRAVIGIGASTGGVEALGTLLAGLPAKFPPVVIVQHMPAAFTTRFAARLNDQFPFPVVEGYDGMAVLPNSVIIAPGGRHLRVVETQGRLTCRLSDDPAVSGHKPSVDVMFNSLAGLGAKAAGVLLTGMGRDGADGLGAMRLAGAMTIAQDKATSVVFGMPKAAIDNGAACIQLPLQRIAAAMLQMSV
jgi:two-component system chemotaxis response regulator CheB